MRTETIPVLIVGAGGHGREVLDALEAMIAVGEPLEFVGFLDDGNPDLDALERRKAVHLGPVERIADHGARYAMGIGAGETRRHLDGLLTAAGATPVSVIHPTAVVGGDVAWGPGCIIFPLVSITTNIRFGRHVHVNRTATVGHDCHVGDYVTVGPGANISGDVTLGDGVTIGTGASIIQGITIGAGSTIGAGAVVVRDIPPNVTAFGVPARPIPPASNADASTEDHSK